MEYKTRRGKMVVAKGKQNFRFCLALYRNYSPCSLCLKTMSFKKDKLADFINRWGDELLKKARRE
jgi:hypothetical protein